MNAASTQIGLDVEQIARMTEENSVAVSQLADAAQHLDGLANALQKSVHRFRV